MKSEQIATNLSPKLNEIGIDGYFKGKVSNMAGLKIKTQNGLIHFLPQSSIIFTQIYLPYL